MKAVTVPANVEHLERVLDLVSDDLIANKCSPKSQMQVSIAIEEILVNIFNYAYNHPDIGDATVQWEIAGDPPRVIIQFIDGGQPYNPLAREDPDVTLPAEERDIGGLGVYLVKKTMDAMSYEYKDGKNILTIQKVL